MNHRFIGSTKNLKKHFLTKQAKNIQIQNASIISIILVVFIHSYNIGLNSNGNIIEARDFPIAHFIEKMFSDGICRSAVPLFFLLSGFLFFKSSSDYDFAFFKSKIIKRTHSLAVPFIIWSASGISVFYLLQKIPSADKYFNSTLIHQLSFKQLLELWLVKPVNFQLWFLQVLYVLVLITPVIGFIMRKIPLLLIFVLASLWFGYGGYNGYINYFFEGLFFFYLGSYFAIFNRPLFTINRIIPFASMWVLLLLCKYFVEDVNYHASILIGKLAVLLGLLVLLKVAGIIRSDFLSKSSIYSFWIFLFHEPFNTIVKKLLLSGLSPLNQNPLLVYFSNVSIALAFSLIIGVLLRKHHYRFYAFLTGGR